MRENEGDRVASGQAGYCGCCIAYFHFHFFLQFLSSSLPYFRFLSRSSFHFPLVTLISFEVSDLRQLLLVKKKKRKMCNNFGTTNGVDERKQDQGLSHDSLTQCNYSSLWSATIFIKMLWSFFFFLASFHVQRDTSDHQPDQLKFHFLSSPIPACSIPCPPTFFLIPAIGWMYEDRNNNFPSLFRVSIKNYFPFHSMISFWSIKSQDHFQF